MERLTTTPFGQRPMTAGLMAHTSLAEARPDVGHVDKWEIFRQLTTARVAFGVTDRDLTVLNALLSFHPSKVLGDNAPLIVFPSNKSLSERAHGMAESTLRRHLASLVRAGLLLRHDSPNGKRYAARGADGELTRAFGFDLRALLVRAREIAEAAQAAEEAAERLRRLREELTLYRRDALKLAEYAVSEGLPGDWEGIFLDLMELHRTSRRKLEAAELETLVKRALNLLERVQKMLHETEEMSGTDVQNERHLHNSNKDSSDLEPCFEKAKGATPAPTPPKLPLALVLKACPDVMPYASHEINHWHEFVATMHLIRGMLGISPHAWEQAQIVMGSETAAIVLAGILQRVDDIRAPGGYLRALTEKAETGAFSPGPMIMALLNRKS
ncbi:plasmid replication protein RepC [Roseobacteraceae bacterium S113]